MSQWTKNRNFFKFAIHLCILQLEFHTPNWLTDWLTEQLSEMNGMEWEKPNKQMNRWRDGLTRDNMISVNMQIFSLNNINIFWKEMNSVHSLTTSLVSFKYIVALTIELSSSI